MNLRTALFGALTAVSMTFAVGCNDDSGTTTDPTDDGGTDVAAIYSTNCAGCHGANGEGVGSFPALTAVVPGLAAGDVETVVRNGQGSMPAFTAAQISDEDLTPLAEWIISEYGS